VFGGGVEGKSMAEETRFGLVLWSTDIGALSRFLVEVAGLVLIAQHPGFAAMEAEGLRVEIHGDDAYRGHPWYDALRKEGMARGIGAELRVRVDDVERAYRRAIQLGGLVMYQPYVDDGRVECQVLAPDGYLLSLWNETGAG
jgi:hypothetical protein